MTTYFLDEFDGTGTLSGRTPNTGANWATGTIYTRVGLSGGKVVQNSANTNENGRAYTTGLVRPYTIQFGVKLYANTGADPYSNSLNLDITPAVYSPGAINVRVFAKTGTVWFDAAVESDSSDYQAPFYPTGTDSGIALGTGEHTVKIVGSGSTVLLYINATLVHTFTLSGNAPNWASGSILHDFTWRREVLTEPTADLLYYYVGDTDYSAPPPPPPPPPEYDEEVSDETTTGDELASFEITTSFEQGALIIDGLSDPEVDVTDETTTATSEVELFAYVQGDELGTATSELELLTTSERTLEELGEISDAAVFTSEATVEDLATGDETATAAITATTTETATASDENERSATATVELEEIAPADDAVFPVYALVVEDTATATDLVLIDAAVMVEDVALASDEVEDAALATDEVIESVATASDEWEAQVTSDALVVETASVFDATFFFRPDLTAWVMNTESGAVTNYTNWAFTDMTQIGNAIYAVGPQGVALLGGNRDDTDFIPARAEYDYLEFGDFDRNGRPNPNEYKKRVDNFWVGLVSDGRLQFTVETYGQGYGVQRYRLEPHKAARPRNSRVSPGKGLNARWWKFAVENVSGAQFEITSLSADVAQSNRRT